MILLSPKITFCVFAIVYNVRSSGRIISFLEELQGFVCGFPLVFIDFEDSNELKRDFSFFIYITLYYHPTVGINNKRVQSGDKM